MADQPVVSIVVPAYNHGRYLDACLESVLAQSYPAVELIVLDDGSTDETPAVLERYGDRFRWERQPNMGQSATLNKGWGMSRGDILGYLSADDILLPDAAAEAVAVFQARPDVVAAYPDFTLIDSGSRPLRQVRAPDYNAVSLLLDLVCQPGPGAFFRRSAWNLAGPWNPLLRQNPDLDFWMRLALQGDFARIPKTLACFRQHEASQTYRRADPARAEEPLVIIKGFLGRDDLPAWLRARGPHALASAHLASAQLHLHAGRIMTALHHIGVALKQCPARVFSVRTVRMLASALGTRMAYRIRGARADRA